MASYSKNIPSSSSFSSSTSGYQYDVFLSFRGTDTRNNFTAHLYEALVRAGIKTYLDDNELQHGDDISSKLKKAIEESRISIVVFSQNYASSRWCLNELLKIVECWTTNKQLVIPIFYHIHPSDVRHQKGKFGEAFEKYNESSREEEKSKATPWRDALTQVANISGADLNFLDSKGNEAHFIKHLVEEKVMYIIKQKTPLDVADHQVAMDSRLKYVEKLMGEISEIPVGIIGITGMGGIGKTTIAKAVYNSISQEFDGSCFLDNVTEVSRQSGGVALLQEKLLSSILKIQNLKVDSDSQGKTWMKERLRLKKVLIVLDDLNDDRRLVQSLVGQRDWFGFGSRIIITTRNKHLLKNVEVDKEYEVELLNPSEALKLFSGHAFGNDFPPECYVKHIDIAVKHCHRLPLALVVFGSYLRGRDVAEWREACRDLNDIEDDEIPRTLRISFDRLGPKGREMFLDIASIFLGMDKKNAIERWEACGKFSEIAFNSLIEKHMITIKEFEGLRMHDLLRDIGVKAIHGEYKEDPGKHSRLWIKEDIKKVLESCTGTENIKAIIDPRLWREVLPARISIKAFEGMHGLRLLEIRDIYLMGSFENIFKELRWLDWYGCPLECLPSSFHSTNMVVLKLRSSQLRELWKNTLFLENLKVLDDSQSPCLQITPDFRGVPRLERLLLWDCDALKELHPSIGHLNGLVKLDLGRCSRLTRISLDFSSGLTSLKTPNIDELECCNVEFGTICSLPSLEELVFSNCDLKEEHIQSSTTTSSSSLKDLDLTGNASLKKLPCNFLTQLSSLTCLRLRYCSSLESLPELFPPTLTTLSLDGCSSLESLPELFPPTLTTLNLDGCSSLESLPELFSPTLTTLSLDGCSSLESLPELFPPILTTLNLDGCSSLESLPKLFPPTLTTLSLDCCSSLQSLPELFPPTLTTLSLDGCSSLQSLLELFPPTLTTLSLVGCSSLQSLPELFPPTLTSLILGGCSSLESLPELFSPILTSLTLGGCSSLESLPELFPHTLTSLNLGGCSSLQSLPKLFPPTLTSLNLGGCSSLQSLPELFPPTLTFINLGGCSSLQSLPDLFLPMLTILYLNGCSSLKSLPEIFPPIPTTLYLDGCSSLEWLLELFSPTLTTLILDDCSNLESLPGIFPPTLTGLWLYGCSSLKSLPELFPPTLTTLPLISCSSLKSLPEVFPTNLTTLTLFGCSSLKSLPELFPPTLTTLSLDRCSSLESLPELFPPTLTTLSLDGCSILESLPKLFPFTLTTLSLDGCLSLESLPELFPPILTIVLAFNCNSLRQLPNYLCTKNLQCLTFFLELSHMGITCELLPNLKIRLSPMKDIISWLEYEETKSSISFQFPTNSCSANNFLGFTLFLQSCRESTIQVKINDYTWRRTNIFAGYSHGINFSPKEYPIQAGHKIQISIRPNAEDVWINSLKLNWYMHDCLNGERSFNREING